jgi:hypothetical protein
LLFFCTFSYWEQAKEDREWTSGSTLGGFLLEILSFGSHSITVNRNSLCREKGDREEWRTGSWFGERLENKDREQLGTQWL